MNRRDFFTTLAFAVLTFFVRRETQARIASDHIEALEGKTIPRGLYISQVVGRGRPLYPQRPIPILHQKSVVEGYDWPPGMNAREEWKPGIRGLSPAVATSSPAAE